MKTKQHVMDDQTDSYVQRVPDKCDRIIWHNRYIHLTGYESGIEKFNKTSAANVAIDCRTCVYWTGEDCNNNTQCVDADLYRQISNVIQVWKRSEE